MTGNDTNWADVLAAAVHDERGHLSNIVVALSLLKRKPSVSADPSALDVIRRIETATTGLVDMTGHLQLLAEVESNEDLRAGGPTTVEMLTRKARRMLEKSGLAPMPDVVGDESLVLELPPEAAAAALVSLLQGARALSGDGEEPILTVSSDAGHVVLRVEVVEPIVSVTDTSLLFDGTWHDVGRPDRRGVPLGVYVAKRLAQECGGDLTAEVSDARLTFVLRVQASDRKPPEMSDWDF